MTESSPKAVQTTLLTIPPRRILGAQMAVLRLSPQSETPVATRTYRVRPGGDIVRQTKSRSDRRPGWRYIRTAPKWWRAYVNRQERHRARLALLRAADHAGPFRRHDWYG